MFRGLILGKFMPIHTGHIKLIDHALTQCDELIVWICATYKEPIPGNLRLKWIKEIFKDNKKVVPVLFEYDESIFPNTSESSRSISLLWSKAIKQYLPKIDVVVSSEKYGDYIAEYLYIKHAYYSMNRTTSATSIRNNPYLNWDSIPDVVKPYFFRKICILGTEATGKSTLAIKLAEYFGSDFIPEVGREIVENTYMCKKNDLIGIARIHAEKILLKEKEKNKILFVDTDITTTKSYSKFLFNVELQVDPWVIDANKCDLHLYLDKDVSYFQDGTRLSEPDRNKLDEFHKKELQEANIPYFLISGNWDDRFDKSLKIIREQLGIKSEMH